MEAIAIAGGRLTTRSFASRSWTQLSQEQEAFDVLLDSYWADIAIEARLVAERDDLGKIAFPPDLLEAGKEPRVAEIIANEERVFASRRKAVKDEEKLLLRSRGRYREEIKALNAVKKAIEKKSRIVGTQLKKIEGLADKGFAPESRVLSVELSVTRVEQEARANAVSIIDAQLGLNQVDLSLANLRNGRASSISAALQVVRNRLSQSRIRIDAGGERIVFMAREATPQGARGPVDDEAKYIITRVTRDERVVIDANRYTKVLPGDFITVPFPPTERPVLTRIRVPERVKPAE